MSPGRLLGRNLSPEDRKLALRIAAVFAIPMALIMVIPLIAGVIFYSHIANSRIEDNRKLIAEVERERVDRTEAINEFVYGQCLQNEVRDVVIVAQLKAAKQRTIASLPPGPLRRGQLEVLNDGIFALEPPDEPDCEPPPAKSPLRGTP